MPVNVRSAFSPIVVVVTVVGVPIAVVPVLSATGDNRNVDGAGLLIARVDRRTCRCP